MSKRDLFIIIYICIWGIIGILGSLYFNTPYSRDWFDILFNLIFLTITASFVFIKPINKFVNKYIINKLP